MSFLTERDREKDNLKKKAEAVSHLHQVPCSVYRETGVRLFEGLVIGHFVLLIFRYSVSRDIPIPGRSRKVAPHSSGG